MTPQHPEARHEIPGRPPGSRQAWPDRSIAELAGRQRTLITTAQLGALGVRPRTIASALARGRLHLVHRGVHSLVPARARPALAAEQAALLATGPDAVLSHQSAARLHGLRLPSHDTMIHLNIAGPHRRGRTGVVVHRTSTLPRGEQHRVQGLPATSLPRTMIDIAPTYTAVQLAPLIDQALRRTSRTQLLNALALHPRRPGTPRLGALLDPKRPSVDTWSKAEARLRAALLRAGLPSPESNIGIGRYVADLLWREQQVIVEYDSAFYHDLPGPFHSDRSRHNDLAAIAGYELIHVTEKHLKHELERVIVWVALALHRGGGWS